MPKNEDGEFELILGNRQLLSVFFIVVVLLGVFFAMGYILGHNSGPMTSEASAKKPEKPLVVESPTKEQPAAAQPAAQEAPPPAPEKSASAPPEKAAAPAKKEPEKKEPIKEAAKATPPPKQELPKYKPLDSAPATQAAAAPPAGSSYLQLVATKKDEAEVIVDVLRKKGFKAMASQIPDKKEMYRVLVGPVADNTINKTKADLKSAGFPGDQAIPKKTF